MKNYTNIFEKLLRLRQAACSAKLVPLGRRQRAIELWQELQNRDAGKKLTAKEGLELLEKLKGTFASDGDSGNELPECSVCLTEMDESECIILRTCSHVYCESCISRVCDEYSPKCPLCRSPFKKSDMIKKDVASIAAKETSDEQDDSNNQLALADDEKINLSPKLSALLEAIKEMKTDDKGVIFSSWTSFLDLIGSCLEDSGHSFTRLDGTMISTKRNAAVMAFTSDEEDSPRFILCSLKAAGTGINLTRGSWAFMMEPHWNEATENQAMDRIHRLGQTRPVKVIRFVMADSIEARIVALQEAKALQAKGSMQKLKPDEKRRARLDALRGLLEIDSNDDDCAMEELDE